MSNNWAPIVYGRTYNEDYRIIVMPVDFSQEDMRWANEYIKVIMSNPDKLNPGPRWALFENNHYRIVGAACMAGIICDQSNLFRDFRFDYTETREIRVFMGFVTNNAPFFEVPTRDLKEFGQLYEYISTLWKQTGAEYRNRYHVASGEYKYSLSIMKPIPEYGRSQNIVFNQSIDKIKFFPIKEEEKLWEAAANSNGPHSLCTGLYSKKDAIDGPFLNIAVCEATTEETQSVIKHQPEPSIAPNTPEKTQSAPQPKKPQLWLSKILFNKPENHGKKNEKDIGSGQPSKIQMKREIIQPPNNYKDSRQIKDYPLQRKFAKEESKWDNFKENKSNRFWQERSIPDSYPDATDIPVGFSYVDSIEPEKGSKKQSPGLSAPGVKNGADGEQPAPALNDEAFLFPAGFQPADKTKNQPNRSQPKNDKGN